MGLAGWPCLEDVECFLWIYVKNTSFLWTVFWISLLLHACLGLFDSRLLLYITDTMAFHIAIFREEKQEASLFHEVTHRKLFFKRTVYIITVVGDFLEAHTLTIYATFYTTPWEQIGCFFLKKRPGSLWEFGAWLFPVRIWSMINEFFKFWDHILMQKSPSTKNQKENKQTKKAQEDCQWEVSIFNFSSVCFYVPKKLYSFYPKETGREKPKVIMKLERLPQKKFWRILELS